MGPADDHAAAAWRLPVLLLLATVATTSWAGVLQAGSFLESRLADEPLSAGAVELGAAAYVLSLLAILGAHEAGHWFAGRRRGLSMSLPFFLPGVPPIGTFGAVIRLDLQRMAASRLLPVAAWGPIAGFLVLLPVLWVGVSLSEVRPLMEDQEGWMRLGEPLLLQAMIRIQHGEIAAGADLFLHPVAFAGWTGLLVTALNLLPFGQLDGGYIMRAAMGPVHARVAPVLFAGLVVAGILLYPGWLIVAALLVFLVGIRNPHAISEEGLDRRGWGLVLATLVIFALSVTPTPVY